jgi:hypothetical protein
MKRRHTNVVLTAVTLLTALAGCTSILPGTPKPEAGTASGKPAPGGSCSRSATPDACLEWEDTKPKTGMALIEQAKQDPVVAAQMLCSALPSTLWDRFLGAGHYRVIAQGPTCTVSSDDMKKTAEGKYAPVLEVEIFLSPKDSIAGDLAILNKRADTRAMITELAVAGKPVMRIGGPDDANGQGREKEELSVAVFGDSAKPDGGKANPGVLRVRQSMRPPRGQPNDSAVDRSKLDSMRDPLITELLKVLFP